MSRITQFSTIGALMAGCFEPGKSLASLCCEGERAFGLGCSAQISGELTIWNGRIHEATAGETLHCLSAETDVPFMQVTQFVAQDSQQIGPVTHETAPEVLHRFINPDNIFLAVSIEAEFDNLVIRRPQRAGDGTRSVEDVAAGQKVDRHRAITGRLIGFWTPELFGRVSVPGFHFHFLDRDEKISGHVLEFSAGHAILSFEEKETIEIHNPTSAAFRDRRIDVNALDEVIHRIEK